MECKKNYSAIMEKIAEYSHMIWSKGFVDGNGGNISARADKNVFIVTPTLFSKRNVSARDLCFTDAAGKLLPDLMEEYGQNPCVRPTSEFMTHLAIYSSSPEIRAVVHTHPPYVCSYAFTGYVPSEPLSPESAVWMGNLAMAAYAPAGSEKLAFRVEAMAKGRNVLVLQNHGLVAWGRSVEEAYWRTEVTESHCKVCSIMESRNAEPRRFTKQEMEELEIMKSKFVKSHGNE